MGHETAKIGARCYYITQVEEGRLKDVLSFVLWNKEPLDFGLNCF